MSFIGILFTLLNKNKYNKRRNKFYYKKAYNKTFFKNSNTYSTYTNAKNTCYSNNHLTHINNPNIRLCKYRVINKEAEEIFFSLKEKLKESFKNYTVLAEVSMGAFLFVDQNYSTAEEREKARQSFNSKRVDFLIIDEECKPILAIEYHGKGHFKKELGELTIENAIKRDEVKRKALELANIPLVILRIETLKFNTFFEEDIKKFLK